MLGVSALYLGSLTCSAASKSSKPQDLKKTTCLPYENRVTGTEISMLTTMPLIGSWTNTVEHEMVVALLDTTPWTRPSFNKWSPAEAKLQLSTSWASDLSPKRTRLVSKLEPSRIMEMVKGKTQQKYQCTNVNVSKQRIHLDSKNLESKVTKWNVSATMSARMFVSSLMWYLGISNSECVFWIWRCCADSLEVVGNLNLKGLLAILGP